MFQYEAKIPGKRSSRLSLHHDGARKSLAQSKFTPSASASAPTINVTQNPEVSIESKADNAKDSATKESVSSNPTESTTGLLTNNSSTDSTTPGSKKSPMVTFPQQQNTEEQIQDPKTPLKRTKQKVVKKTPLNGSSNRKPGTTPSASKNSPKVPLTAAAKKCFAMVSLLTSQW